MKTSTSILVAVAVSAIPAWAQDANPSTAAATTAPSTSNMSGAWNPSASTNPGTNPLIPNTLSAGCQSFLAKLNAAPEVSTCTSQLVTATSAFTQDGTPSGQAEVETALNQMCADTTSGCSVGLLRNILTHFAGNCSSELQQGISVVQTSYDALYIINPFKMAICTKDQATGSYCYETIAAASQKASTTSPSVSNQNASVSTPSNNILTNKTMLLAHRPSDGTSAFSELLSTTTGQLVVNVANTLSKRASSLLSRQSSATPNNTTNAVQPNSTTFVNTNLPFLFIQPTLPTSALCTACTQDVLAAYVAFEMAMPYAPGLNNSGLLAGQLKLWSSMNDRCGSGFTNAIQTKAGVDSSTFSTSGGLGRVVPRTLMSAAVAVGSYMLVM